MPLLGFTINISMTFEKGLRARRYHLEMMLNDLLDIYSTKFSKLDDAERALLKALLETEIRRIDEGA